MPTYTFSTLNDRDFEELIRDLLSKELRIKLQSFKPGADKGIDLRYSTRVNINHIVVQVKHYQKTGYKGLLASLKREKLKIKKLKCDRYLIATSVNLSPQNKSEICTCLSPYIKSANDIYGNEDINRLLQDYGDIEKRNFKLWLSSTTVLKKIVNNAVEGRSEFLKDKIQRNIKIYVQNRSLGVALKILKNHKFILITGQPGVGKTTLAYILLYSFLAKGFELIFVDKNIRDAEDLLQDPDSKQIFYFDDFLGSSYFEILNAKSSDVGIVNFIERIQNSKNKYLVLTTRTTILKTAKQVYEKINQSDIEIGRKELELKDYSEFDKAKILYNHLYFNKLKKSYRRKVFENRNYWKIIRHQNYNPRLIEFITDERKFEKSNFTDYIKFIFFNLDHPNALWEHSYENQIKDEDRFLLTTLLSLGGTAEETVLEKAFDKRIECEIKENGFQKPNNVFNSVLRRLLEGYIERKHWSETNNRISFVNPSVSDFLISYLKRSNSERHRLIFSTLFLEQIENLFTFLIKGFAPANFIEESTNLISILSTQKFKVLKTSPKQDYKTLFLIKKMMIYSQLGVFEEVQEVTDPLIADLLEKLDFSLLNHYLYFDYLKKILFNRKPEGLVENIIIANWDLVIRSLISCLLLHDDGEDLIAIFESFSVDYLTYINANNNGIRLKNFVESLADSKTSDLISDSEGELKSEEDIADLKEKIDEERSSIFASFSLTDESYDERFFFSDIDEDLLRNNRSSPTKKAIPIISPNKTDEHFTSKDIDDLFDISRLKNMD